MLISLALALAPTLQEPELARPPEEEIRRGWLLEHQDPDGRWDADGFTKHDREPAIAEDAGPGRPEDDVLATSLALWACLGDGRSLGSGPDADALARGVRWLLAQQDLETGLLRDVPHALEVRHHAVATVVLSDFLYEESGPLLRDACERAVAALGAAQAPDGSWGEPRTTAWALFAFAAARDAGVEVPADAAVAGEAWLRSTRAADGFLRKSSGEPDIVATGLDVLRELVALAPNTDRSALSARGALVVDALAGGEQPRDGETWFVAAATALQTGGDTWKVLQGKLRREVLDTQVRGGPFGGSWNRPGASGGRVVETSWNALTLEIYFRYARVFPAR